MVHDFQVTRNSPYGLYIPGWACVLWVIVALGRETGAFDGVPLAVEPAHEGEDGLPDGHLVNVAVGVDADLADLAPFAAMRCDRRRDLVADLQELHPLI